MAHHVQSGQVRKLNGNLRLVNDDGAWHAVGLPWDVWVGGGARKATAKTMTDGGRLREDAVSDLCNSEAL